MPKFWGLANKLVFSKVKAQLGLDRCKILVSGAAPISRQTLLYFMSLDLVMYEQYGMSETSGMPSALLALCDGKPLVTCIN